MPRLTPVVLLAIVAMAVTGCAAAQQLPVASAVPTSPTTVARPATTDSLPGAPVGSTVGSTPETVVTIASPTTGIATEVMPPIPPTVTETIPPAVTETIAPTTTEGAPTGLGGSALFPYATLYDVPQLGADPVRGAGCGVSDGLGDSMPDGLWYGLVYAGNRAGSIGFDVVCAYFGDSALEHGAEPGLEQLLYAVNGSDRRRQIDRADDLVVRQGANTAGACVDPGSIGDIADVPDGASAWVLVEGGVAELVLIFCS